MSDDADRYQALYTEKLWNLLPALYRIEDTPTLGVTGPLRELVARVGAQIAVVRRSIDRLWEDQSIETCDDWVIDYIGELLGTNLVACLDARGRRLDVARTINYRRRKGTVALQEELAANITGWKARVVEFFRRMGRSRHGLDPVIGPAAAADTPLGRLRHVQGLIGLHTGTPAGGLADLRNAYGAMKAHTAFDEFAHTGDVRRGRGMTGWYDIPRLGVFLWRLKSWPAKQVTPVAHRTCPDWYSFDPTGRDVPLFAAGERPFGDAWVSPSEQMLPAPISPELLAIARDDLYAPAASQAEPSLGVFRLAGLDYALVPASELVPSTGVALIDPVRGRFSALNGPFRVDFHYGFSSDIGAGFYNRRDPRQAPVTPAPQMRPVLEPPDLPARLQDAAAGGTGTILIGNSITYDEVLDLAGVQNVTVQADSLCRPLIRLASASGAWVFTGRLGAVLTLDGLLISGGEDLVLDGSFDTVTLRCCTLDPGTWNGAPPVAGWARGVDGRELGPSRIVVEGQVGTLVIDRCIAGPIVEAPGALAGIAKLTINDSIVQAAEPGTDAIIVREGAVELSRCTLLGSARARRFDASECLLHQLVTVDDRQSGCVRFSAWANGSQLPRRYESVAIDAGAGLFVTREFGQPAYAQLRETVSDAIATGAEDGSEMGAFAREKNPIKEQSLLIKYREFMPIGLEPVIVHAT